MRSSGVAARTMIVQTDNGSFPPVFDRDARRRFDCLLRLVDVRGERDTRAACRNAHLVLATRGVFTRPVLDDMKQCRAIVRFGVGVENIDIAAATEAGIVVANVPDFCLDEVAETTAAAILALNRKLFHMRASVTKGEWDRRLARPITRLSRQTLGLIGFGRIARAVAGRMKAFGMHVVACDPYVSAQEISAFSVEPSGLDHLLRRADVISLHLPLTAETHHLIGARQLHAMKRTAYVINTSRGRIIDEDALCAALKERRIAGAALDVLEEEPPVRNNPLVRMENVIVTPHFASYSEEAYQELRAKVREAAIAVLEGRFPEYMVNPAVKNNARLISVQ